MSSAETSDASAYTVSVVIPAYNVEKYIGRAVESVLAQTRAADEVIVVDDGSTDGTAEAVRAFGDRVVFMQQANSGASVARNAGVTAAKSEWVAFLDADDEWLPEKLAVQVEHLRRHPDLQWSATNYEIRPIDGSASRLTYDSARFAVPREGQEYIEDYFDAVAAGMAISTITIMVRKRVIVEAGMFRVGQLWAQDTDLFFRIAYRHARIGFIRKALSINHFGRGGSITQINRCDIEQRCELLERHLSLAAEAGMSESFRPCAATLLTRWLRGYVDDPSVDISAMIERFKEILPLNIRVEMRLRKAFPRLGGALLRGYFGAKKNLGGGGSG